jgi:hypothetical protein|tara:strand:- start:84 stop:248 length:165 start_codon:yes stop_codon:yes gene_type:complete
MKVGDLVRLEDSTVEVWIGIITKIYQHANRPCCDIFFADGSIGEVFYLAELEAI